MTFDILQACKIFTEIKTKQLVPLLSETLLLPSQEIFYHWCFRQIKQRGVITEGEWWYFFHGMECDLRHISDGRYVRIEFGPGGRIDTFTNWGLLNFIVSSKEPWPDFLELKNYLMTTDSDSLKKMKAITDELSGIGLIQPVAPELETKQKLAQSLQDEYLYFDAIVCKRFVISPKGWKL